MPIPIGKRRKEVGARTKVVSCIVFLLGVNRFSKQFSLALFLDTESALLGNKWERKLTLADSFESKNKRNPSNKNDVIHFLPGLIDSSLLFFSFNFSVMFCFFILICPPLGIKS